MPQRKVLDAGTLDIDTSEELPGVIETMTVQRDGKSYKFPLDKSEFRMGKMENRSKEYAKERKYWLSKTPIERLNAAWFLICQAYNLDPSVQHKVDRTVFSRRKRS